MNTPAPALALSPQAQTASRHRTDPGSNTDNSDRAGTCPGWRTARRCTDQAGRQLTDPHPACLASARREIIERLTQEQRPPPNG